MKNEKNLLAGLIPRFNGKKIAVWGDFILDEYLYGHTRRISREAPVLILGYEKRELSLGGAGNALLNLHALGAEPIPVGVIGTDATGETIIEIMQSKGITTNHLVREKTFETPMKTRIFAGEENTRKQQVLRIDREGTVPDDPVVKEKLSAALFSLREESCALLISDYHYFTVKEDVFRDVLPAFQSAGRPVTLDSRFRLMNFKGVTAATPNEPEAQEVLKIEIGDNSPILLEAGRHILRKMKSSALLITRGSRGMALFEKGKAPFFIPIHGSADIVDVTGAGDTVISVFTLALACGSSYKQAALLANYAGGVVVMKKGTATLTLQELEQAILS